MSDEKYKTIANKRLTTAIKYLRMVKKMTASRNYEVEEEDITAITERLTSEVNAIESAFLSRTKKKEEIEDVL